METRLMIPPIELITNEIITHLPKERLELVLVHPPIHMEPSGKPFYIKKYPTHRRHVNNNPVIQMKFDKVLRDLGYRTTLSNSISVVTDMNVGFAQYVSGDGSPYVVFPMNDMHFLWIDDIDLHEFTIVNIYAHYHDLVSLSRRCLESI